MHTKGNSHDRSPVFYSPYNTQIYTYIYICKHNARILRVYKESLYIDMYITKKRNRKLKNKHYIKHYRKYI